jgi:hypothetical protein
MSICANTAFTGKNYMQASGLELKNVIRTTLARDCSA